MTRWCQTTSPRNAAAGIASSQPGALSAPNASHPTAAATTAIARRQLPMRTNCRCSSPSAARHLSCLDVYSRSGSMQFKDNRPLPWEGMANPWLHWWTNIVTLMSQPTYPRLVLALVLGSVIGAERQWRQRAAGMRTNTLVCFGAAAFVDLGSTIGGPNTTNIIAYT